MSEYLNYSASAPSDGYVQPNINLRAITTLSVDVSGSCDWQLEASLDGSRWYKLLDDDNSLETFGANNPPVKFIVDNYKFARVYVFNCIGAQTIKAKGLYVATSLGGGGSGTITGATNLGAGDGIFAQVNGSNLEFKSLTEGSNITITASGTELEIAATGTAGISETTFQENKSYWNESIHHLRIAGDGYATAANLTGLESTEVEHYVQASQAFQSVLQALDGYAQNVTELEHTQQQNQINQSILQALDGYGGSGVTSAQGSDGYITFFTSATTIEGDNDWTFNRETHDVTLTGGGDLRVGDANFNLTPDGYTGGNPALTFDSGDRIGYDRTNNRFAFEIGSAARGSIGGAGLHFVMTGNQLASSVADIDLSGAMTGITHTILGGTLSSHSTIHWDFDGEKINAGTDTCALSISLGGAAIHTSTYSLAEGHTVQSYGTISLFDNTTAYRSHAYSIKIPTSGAGNSHLDVSMTAISDIKCSNIPGVSLDFSSNRDIKMSVSWSGSGVFRLYSFHLYIMG